MGNIVRAWSCLLLLAFGASAFAQESTSWVSAKWAPMSEENEKLFQQAEANFNIAVEQAKQKAEEEERPGHRASRKELDAAGVATGVHSSSNGPLSEGGMSGSMGPGSVNPGTVRGKNSGRWLTLQELLPASLDFAAPRSGGLIVQRTSTSVVFARTDSQEIVMLPLSGDETDIVHGMRATIHEVDGNLRMLVGLPTGTQVLFEYQQDPDPAKHVMSVDIRIGGGPPGTGVELKRLYRQSQVNVRPLQKAGQ
jgi:hypothetical protein